MLDRITGLQVFSRVAAMGTISAAARALGMSQTMATKHLGALEARLGVKLVHRTTRRLTLSEAGRTYLETVERLLAELNEADLAAAAETFEVQGTLRLNAPVSFGIRELAPLIADLSVRHPALTIDLGLNDRQVDLIEEGWDLAIRIGTLRDSPLVARRLGPCHTMVAAAPSYLARRGRPLCVADLAHHNCLGYTLSRSVGVDRWVFGPKHEVAVDVAGNLRANNGDALVAAAIAGQGVIYQPTFLVDREVRDGLLVPIELDHETVELDGIFAIYPANRRPPAKVRATIDFLLERFSEVPPRKVDGP